MEETLFLLKSKDKNVRYHINPSKAFSLYYFLSMTKTNVIQLRPNNLVCYTSMFLLA